MNAGPRAQLMRITSQRIDDWWNYSGNLRSVLIHLKLNIVRSIYPTAGLIIIPAGRASFVKYSLASLSGQFFTSCFSPLGRQVSPTSVQTWSFNDRVIIWSSIEYRGILIKYFLRFGASPYRITRHFHRESWIVGSRHLFIIESDII